MCCADDKGTFPNLHRKRRVKPVSEQDLLKHDAEFSDHVKQLSMFMKPGVFKSKTASAALTIADLNAPIVTVKAPAFINRRQDGTHETSPSAPVGDQMIKPISPCMHGDSLSSKSHSHKPTGWTQEQINDLEHAVVEASRELRVRPPGFFALHASAIPSIFALAA